MSKFWRPLLSLGTVLLFVTAAPVVAQTITTGQLVGTVTDPSGAVLANASVQLKSIEQGSVTTTKTNGKGYYDFSYLRPGTYSVSVTAGGFQSSERTANVALGGSSTVNFQLALGSSSTTVEVSAAAAQVDTQDADLTANFDAKQLDLLPNPGNDLSAVALTAPGVVMNTAGGATFGGGNFEVNGLPATSNLFTLDGSNDNDPYFNVNNSGATNLTLGLNDVEESTVVSNGYSGSYGGLAGANINYVTKSGTNAFHGNAIYWWNGNILNGNNYFRNQANGLAGSDVQPRPFVNDNQYAGSFGGPIVKDKAFFFFDLEGLQLAIPSPTSVNVPTTAFENAVIANLNATGLSASVPFYQTAFGLWNQVPQGGARQLSGGGCSDVTTLNGVAFGAANPCALSVQAALSAHTHDKLYVGKVDLNITHNDKLFVRVEREHGLQASYTDPINKAFNAISDQPQWQSQVGETHTFGSDKVNDFKASLLWYSATFTPQSQSAADSALPYPGPNGTATLAFGDGSLGGLNALGFIFPQGRNITQYQFVDDFSWVHGRNNFKVGANFHRDDVNDQNFVIVTPLIEPFSLDSFATGGLGGAGDIDVQNFPSHRNVPIALYQVGFYGSDDVRVTNNLKLTLSLRFDHLSDPVCQTNCFQRFTPGAFGDSAAPVNSAITSGLHTAFPSVTAIVAQPKIGFAWSPGGSQKTVLRGGIGIFGDALPTGAIDSFLQNAPLDPGFNTLFGYISPAQTGAYVNPAFGVNCAANCTLNQMSFAADASFKANYAGGGAVTPFNFYNANKVTVPTYYKWSLEAERALGWKTTLNVLYVGNHGSHEEFSNQALNAFAPAPGFANLPTTIPDSRFGVVSDARNVANSNYNGLTITANHSFSGGFQFQASYTWSHALDEISNNSLSPFGLNTTGLYADIVYPQNPFNYRQNYGNADYDIRHNFVMNYVWNDGFRHLTQWGPNALLKGWTFSGTIIAHTGLPFTVWSSSVTQALEATNYGPGGGTQYILSDVTGPSTISCGASAATVNNIGQAAAPCLGPAAGQPGTFFPDPTTTYGDERRNQYRGPRYFDSDFAVEKAFGLGKWENAQFSLGARFFNVFNHPDFYFPVMNANSSQFGQIIQTISSPTSIYGSGLGADASPRVIQLQAKFVF